MWCLCFIEVYLFRLPPPSLWALFVLLLLTLVCRQSTELIWVFFLINFPILLSSQQSEAISPEMVQTSSQTVTVPAPTFARELEGYDSELNVGYFDCDLGGVLGIYYIFMRNQL